MAIITIPSSIAGVSLPGSLSNLARGPLNALFQGTGIETLNYPSDLATDPTKSHYVTFYVKELVPVDYNSNEGVEQGQKVYVGQNAVDLFEKSGYKAADVVTKGVSAGISITPKRFEARNVISLYMPDNLIANYNSDYSDFSLTSVGGSTIRNIDEVIGQLNKIDTKNVLGSLKNIIGSDPAVTALATQAFSKQLGAVGINGENLGQVLLKGQGQSINPQLQLMYNGLQLRQFSLSFVFTPKSKDEAQTVARIIKMFKYHFSPGLEKGKDNSSNSMFLQAPSIFNVKFKINNVENEYLPKYGDCVLTDIDVNYAPNGWAAFEDGSPVQTTLNLQFKETEIVDKTRILEETLR
jgi:hypothetical protein